MAPASAATSSASGKGKKASEATAQPASGKRARLTARLAESTRLIWPAPTPTVIRSLTRMMAFDLVCFATRQAKSRSPHSASVGCGC